MFKPNSRNIRRIVRWFSFGKLLAISVAGLLFGVNLLYVSFELSGSRNRDFSMALIFPRDESTKLVDYCDTTENGYNRCEGSIQIERSGDFNLSFDIKPVFVAPPILPLGVILVGADQHLTSWQCDLAVKRWSGEPDYSAPVSAKPIYGYRRIRSGSRTIGRWVVWYFSFESPSRDTLQATTESFPCVYKVTLRATVDNARSPMDSPLAWFLQGKYLFTYSVSLWDGTLDYLVYDDWRYHPDYGDKIPRVTTTFLQDRDFLVDTLETRIPSLYLETEIPGTIEGGIVSNTKFWTDYSKVQQDNYVTERNISGTFTFTTKPMEVARYGIAGSLFILSILFRKRFMRQRKNRPKVSTESGDEQRDAKER